MFLTIIENVFFTHFRSNLHYSTTAKIVNCLVVIKKPNFVTKHSLLVSLDASLSDTCTSLIKVFGCQV